MKLDFFKFFKYGVEFSWNPISYFIICFCSFEFSFEKIHYDGTHYDLKLGLVEFNWLF